MQAALDLSLQIVEPGIPGCRVEEGVRGRANNATTDRTVSLI